MEVGWPADVSLYKLLTDWGGFIGAIIALLAALFAFGAVRAQTKEAQREYREQRATARHAAAQEELVATYLMEAALEGFKYDLYHVLNTFDIGTDDQAFLSAELDRERVRFIRQRIRPLTVNTILPYIGRIKAELAREFSFIVWISERTRDKEGSSTNGELRKEIRDILKRTEDLQAEVTKQSGRAQPLLDADE